MAAEIITMDSFGATDDDRGLGHSIDGIRSGLPMATTQMPTNQAREDVSLPGFGRFGNFFLRADVWPAVLLTVGGMGWHLWRLRLPQAAMRATWRWEFFFVCLLLAGIRFCHLLVCAFVRACCVDKYRIPPLRRSYWPWAVGMIALGAIAGQFQWPLKLGFLLSRPAMDRLADAALADPDSASSLAGQYAGVYPVTKVEVLGDTVVLHTSRAPPPNSMTFRTVSVSDPLDNHGFVRMPRQPRTCAESTVIGL
jgi:hypothetical protein